MSDRLRFDSDFFQLFPIVTRLLRSYVLGRYSLTPSTASAKYISELWMVT